MQATVFDIDGTLIDSFTADSDLYVSAVSEVLGIAGVDSNWSAYRHVTDEGILREIMHVHGIAPAPQLIAATKQRFIALLRKHIEDHGPFREIPGAVHYVSRLLASPGHYVAYATGAWRESALLKLQSAGLPTQGVSLSTSSEFEDRVSIMRGALANAPATIGRITYYGDGVWDQKAVSELGWEFVAVGERLNGISDYHAIASTQVWHSV